MTREVHPVQAEAGGRPVTAPPGAASLDSVPTIDRHAVKQLHRWLSPVLEKYFRSEVRGVERFPSEQTIVVTHHDGGVLPINGFCIGVAWHERFAFGRDLYVLSHDLFHRYSRGISERIGSLGIVPADRGTMDAALGTGASVLVMPGAARESFRPFWRRAEIDLGGRQGFVAQAIRWDVPITPVVSAGSHETVVVLHRGGELARRLGVPRLVRSADVLPLLAGFPWGIWALPFVPQFPLPAKLTTEVLAPMYLPKALGRKLRPRDAEDPTVVRAGFDAVLAVMQPALKRLYAERRFPVLG
jgi:1-acyl-sn-glycerol-3-phosphate acyltransferase